MHISYFCTRNTMLLWIMIYFPFHSMETWFMVDNFTKFEGWTLWHWNIWRVYKGQKDILDIFARATNKIKLSILFWLKVGLIQGWSVNRVKVCVFWTTALLYHWHFDWKGRNYIGESYRFRKPKAKMSIQMSGIETLEHGISWYQRLRVRLKTFMAKG